MVDNMYQQDEQRLMDRLDQALPPDTQQIGDYDDDPLVEAARQLARGPRPELSDAAQDRIEQQVLARAATILRTDGANSLVAMRGPRQPVRQMQRTRWHTVRRKATRTATRALRNIAAMLIAVFMFSSGLAVASAQTLPGDDLYPVKTIIEELQLTIVSSDSEANLRVELAERRLDEFEQLIKERQEVNAQVLVESSAQLNRALTLLEQGHGSRIDLDPRIANLSYRQAALIQYAEALAPPEEYAGLVLVADWNNLLIGRVLSGGVVKYSNPVVATIRRTSFQPLIPETVPEASPEPDATDDEQSMSAPRGMVLHIGCM